MHFLFPRRRSTEDERRLTFFGFEGGSPELAVPEEDQGPEKEKRTEESREEEQIDPEKIEQEVQNAINEADSEVATDWKSLANRYEKAVNSAKAVAEEYPENTEQAQLVEDMQKTLAVLQAHAAGEQPQGEAQSDGNPEQKKEQTPEEQAYAKLAERLGIKPEALGELKAAVGKLTPQEAAHMEKIMNDYAKQPPETRDQWLADQLKTAPDNVRNAVVAIEKLQNIINKPAEGTGEKKEKKNEFKDFAKKFGELIEMIRDLLAECGLIEKREKKEKAETKTDKAADDALGQEVDTFLKQAVEKPGDPKKTKTKLEDFGKQTDKHLSDANGDLKAAKELQKSAGDELQAAKDEKTALEADPQESDVKKSRLAELTESIQRLETSIKETENTIKVNEARVNALKELKTKIDAAIAALPKEQAKPEAKQENQSKKPPEAPAQKPNPSSEPDMPVEGATEPPNGESPPAVKPQTDKPAESSAAPQSEGEEKPAETVAGPPAEWQVKGNERAVSTWMRTQEKAAADRNQLGELPAASRVNIERSGISIVADRPGQPTVVSINKAEWVLGMKGNDTVLQMKNKPEVSVIIPRDTKIDQRSLETYAAQALKYFNSEIADEAGMGEGFEIAKKGEALGYITLADRSDPLTKQDADNSAMFPSMLSRRYNVNKAPGGDIDGSKTDPLIALRKQIDTMKENNVKTIYINVFAHGSEGAMHFGRNQITPAQFMQVFKDYPDCKFTMNTLACYGGGMEDMKGFKDTAPGAEKGRVAVFSQTKGDVVNYGGKLGADYSTRYNASLAKYLMQGVDGRPGAQLSYGEAHLRADREAKLAQFTDAEVFSSRPGDISAHTAATMDPTKFQGMS